MKYRNLYKNEDGTYNIIWFGSKGLSDQYVINNIHNEYTDLDNVRIETYPADNSSFYYHFTGVGTRIRAHGSLNLTCKLIGYDKNNASYILYDYTYTYRNPTATSTVITPTRTDTFTIDFNNYDIQYCIFTVNRKASNINIDYETHSYLADFYNELGNTEITDRTSSEEKKLIIEARHDNYSEKQEGIKNSLIQRLAIIKGELWYNINYGLPLLDKLRNKAVMDAAIIKIINSHEEISTIKKYKSSVDNHVYSFEFIAETIYGTSFSFSSDYLY